MYRSKMDDCSIAIEEARARVAKAQQAYSRGTGSLAAVNAANKQLANAHFEHRSEYGLRIPKNDRLEQ